MSEPRTPPGRRAARRRPGPGATNRTHGEPLAPLPGVVSPPPAHRAHLARERRPPPTSWNTTKWQPPNEPRHAVGPNGARRVQPAIDAGRPSPIGEPVPLPLPPPRARHQQSGGHSPNVEEVTDDLEVAGVLNQVGHSFHLCRGRDGEVGLAPSLVAAMAGEFGGEVTQGTGDRRTARNPGRNRASGRPRTSTSPSGRKRRAAGRRRPTRRRSRRGAGWWCGGAPSGCGWRSGRDGW